MTRNFSLAEQYQFSADDKARIACDFAAKGDYQQAIYRLTDAIKHLNDAISEIRRAAKPA